MMETLIFQDFIKDFLTSRKLKDPFIRRLT